MPLWIATHPFYTEPLAYWLEDGLFFKAPLPIYTEPKKAALKVLHVSWVTLLLEAA